MLQREIFKIHISRSISKASCCLVGKGKRGSFTDSDIDYSVLLLAVTSVTWDLLWLV